MKWLAAATLLCFIAGTPQSAAGEPARRSTSLAGEWHWLPHDGEGDYCSPSINDSGDDSGWATMRLPSSWFLLGESKYPAKARARLPVVGKNDPGELAAVDPEPGFDYSGTVWFRK